MLCERNTTKVIKNFPELTGKPGKRQNISNRRDTSDSPGIALTNPVTHNERLNFHYNLENVTQNFAQIGPE